MIWASKDEFRRQKRGLRAWQAESSLVACVRVLITSMFKEVYRLRTLLLDRHVNFKPDSTVWWL